MPKLDSCKISLLSVKSLATVKIFSTLDFILADVENIVSNSDLNPEDVLTLKRQFITNHSSVPVSGSDYYLSVKNNGFIKSNIIGLDRLLEGGIMKGSILELCGPVSCGKTQLCHSIAVNVATLAARVDYIDTKLEFSASRCNSLLPGTLNDQDLLDLVERVWGLTNKPVVVTWEKAVYAGYNEDSGDCTLLAPTGPHQPETRPRLDSRLLTPPAWSGLSQLGHPAVTQLYQLSRVHNQDMDKILEHINVHNPKNIHQLVSTIEGLMKQYQNFTELNKIVIIDSMTAPYLPLVGLTTNKGLSLLSYIASSLKELASSHNAAVIITNLGVKYFEENEEHKKNPNEIKPLLGKFWLHVPNTRILMNRENLVSSKRCLCILKSDYLQTNKIGEINITEYGVT